MQLVAVHVNHALASGGGQGPLALVIGLRDIQLAIGRAGPRAKVAAGCSTAIECRTGRVQTHTGDDGVCSALGGSAKVEDGYIVGDILGGSLQLVADVVDCLVVSSSPALIVVGVAVGVHHIITQDNRRAITHENHVVGIATHEVCVADDLGTLQWCDVAALIDAVQDGVGLANDLVARVPGIHAAQIAGADQTQCQGLAVEEVLSHEGENLVGSCLARQHVVAKDGTLVGQLSGCTPQITLEIEPCGEDRVILERVVKVGTDVQKILTRAGDDGYSADDQPKEFSHLYHSCHFCSKLCVSSLLILASRSCFLLEIEVELDGIGSGDGVSTAVVLGLLGIPQFHRTPHSQV